MKGRPGGPGGRKKHSSIVSLISRGMRGRAKRIMLESVQRLMAKNRKKNEKEEHGYLTWFG